MISQLQPQTFEQPEPVVRVYCHDCGAITDHAIDFFGNDPYWTCNVCGEPQCPAEPSQSVERDDLCLVPKCIDSEPDYDPYDDDPVESEQQEPEPDRVGAIPFLDDPNLFDLEPHGIEEPGCDDPDPNDPGFDGSCYDDGPDPNGAEAFDFGFETDLFDLP